MAAKVSVYITAHNYGKYIEESIESVLRQTLKDWELVIINDASTDNTREILKKYAHTPAIKIIDQKKNLGLTKSANKAIQKTKGTYIVRLDADDYLEENCLLILSTYLDQHPDIGLVYPDYYHVTEDGQVIEQIRRKKVNEEAHLLDLPAHGAGTMIRRTCFDALGGYNEEISCQDGYDLWLRFIDRYKVHNVNLPLFYYRKHGTSITTNTEKLLKTRRYIKMRFVKEKYKNNMPTVLGIIPVRGSLLKNKNKLVLSQLGGKTLLEYSINEAKQTELLNQIVVVTEDPEILEYAKSLGVHGILRPKHLSQPKVPIEPTIHFVLKALYETESYIPDLTALLHVNAPLKKAEHITEAINTLLIFNSDSVVSVCEDSGHFYQHREFGLEPLFKKRLLRLEQESLYRENGAIFVSRTSSITENSFLGAVVSHIIMQKENSIQIDDEFDLWVVEKILESKSAIV